MTGKGSLKRLPGLLFALAFCVSLLMTSVSAANAGSLALSYGQDGAEFNIYRVAVLNGGAYELTGAFAEYPVNLSAADWTDTAVTLEAYAQLDSIAPDGTGSISGGSITFAGLEEGLYLVVGEDTTSDEYRFIPASFLVYVEGDVTSVVKYEEIPAGVENEITSCVVKKVWNEDTKAVRPSSVTVRLLKDGEEYDTQTLNKSNGWSYTWDELDATADWQIVEIGVAENYTVSISRSSNSFTVTNTYQTETSTTPSDPTDDTADTTSSTGTKLPQTGQLWWPVILMGAAGLLLVVLGFLWTKRNKNEK
ncbi:MAG: Cna B-type domain-containing protein [Clostridiales bacterium]|nr:Cna B-type domain-containing protein [Clostridiales bacterium]